MLERVDDEVWTAAYRVRMGGGIVFPTRMTVVRLDRSALALISLAPVDHSLADELARLGEVRYLVAPNALHHVHLAAASRRWPEAHVLGPSSLAKKKPEVLLAGVLEDPLPPPLAAVFDTVWLAGAPSVDETVFFHRPSGTVLTTDLVFNVRPAPNLPTAILLFLIGCLGRCRASRSWRLFVRDRAALRASLDRILAWPAQHLVPAHGNVVRGEGRAALACAVAWIHGSRPILPASTGT